MDEQYKDLYDANTGLDFTGAGAYTEVVLRLKFPNNSIEKNKPNPNQGLIDGFKKRADEL